MQVQFNPDQCFLSQTSCSSWWSGLTWYCSDSFGWTVWYCLSLFHHKFVIQVKAVAFMDTCLCLCSRVKELKRAREHETPQKSPLAMWHHSPDSSFLFLFVPKTFYKRNGKKHQCKHCNYYYFCSVTGSTTITCTTAFFHISILSTDLILVGEWQLLRDYKL